MHLQELLDLPNFKKLQDLGKCGHIIYDACREYTATKTTGQVASEVYTNVLGGRGGGLSYSSMQVLMPVWTNWASSEGEYVGSTFQGYTVQTVIVATPMMEAPADGRLRWSVSAREVLGLFQHRRGLAFFHFGTAWCRGQEYGLDLVLCPIESPEKVDEDNVCRVRLVLKQLGTSTSEVVVIDFKNCYASPVHHNFEQHVFVSGLLSWPKKEVMSVLSTCIESKELFTIEATLCLF